MFEVHIMPDAALASALALMSPPPAAGVSFRLSMHSQLSDAEAQKSAYEARFPGYVLSIVEV
jgi:hypothetical protein